MRRVTASLIVLLFAAPALAQEPVREREHTVRDGDTLWDLASFYYTNPFRWPVIYEANTTVVEDPHWIYPEEVLVIPGISGDTEPAPRVALQPRPEAPLRTVFYTPPPVRQNATGDRPTVLSEPDRSGVPVRVGEFNSALFVTPPGNLRVMGRFVRAVRENRDVGGAPSAHPREPVFLGYTNDRPEAGQRLMLVRVRERLAGMRIIEPTGIVRVTSLEADVMRATIDEQYGQILPGQLAIPVPFYPDFQVERAALIEGGPDLEGRLLAFIDDPPMPSRTDKGFVNLGSEHGVKVGDVFTAYLPERASRERRTGEFGAIERLPTEDVARLRVVRVTERVATVVVDALLLPLLEAQMRVRRTHRIP